MKYNLLSIKEFSFLREIRTIFRTILAILGKNMSRERSIMDYSVLLTVYKSDNPDF